MEQDSPCFKVVPIEKYIGWVFLRCLSHGIKERKMPNIEHTMGKIIYKHTHK